MTGLAALTVSLLLEAVNVQAGSAGSLARAQTG